MSYSDGAGSSDAGGVLAGGVLTGGVLTGGLLTGGLLAGGLLAGGLLADVSGVGATVVGADGLGTFVGATVGASDLDGTLVAGGCRRAFTTMVHLAERFLPPSVNFAVTVAFFVFLTPLTLTLFFVFFDSVTVPFGFTDHFVFFAFLAFLSLSVLVAPTVNVTFFLLNAGFLAACAVVGLAEAIKPIAITAVKMLAVILLHVLIL